MQSTSRLALKVRDSIMLANYGYSDGSGNYFITIDTDKCTGCGDCVSVCPAEIFVVVEEDPNDPMNDQPVAMCRPDKKKKVKYECGPCKPSTDRPPLPCVQICHAEAISHSW
jgi:ferredoxin